MNRKRTIIYFDYGGCYSRIGDDVHWIAKEDVNYYVMMKKSKKDVTFSMLVEEIRKKIEGGQSTNQKLKLSFIPLANPRKRPVYISNDADVEFYLLTEVEGKSVINVELVEQDGGQSLGEEERYEQTWRGEADEQTWRCETDEQTWRGEADTYGSRNEEPMEYFEQLEFMRSQELSVTGLRMNDPVSSGGALGLEDVDISVDNVEDATVQREDGVEVDHNVAREWEDGLQMTVGQLFESKREFQDKIDIASRVNCFEFDILKSDKKLYSVKCRQAGNGCKWRIRAAKDRNSDNFSIRTYKNIHTCSRTNTSTSRTRRKGSSRLVTSILDDDYPGQFDTPKPNSLINMVLNRFGVTVSYSTAWRGRKSAIENFRGSAHESFEMVCSYMYMLESMNPGTKSRVELKPDGRFKYLFFALGASIEGFNFMRKVIIVDGTFIKTAFKGVLIVATAQDPNRHNYPIAFGVVDSENDDSMIWFMNMLKTIVPDSGELVFVSDRNQSIIKSIREVYPNSKHGYCIYHLSQNVKSQVGGAAKRRVGPHFRRCAQEYKETRFHKLYAAFREMYPAAAAYLDTSVEEEKWAKCYFPGERYNIDTTNSAESINSSFVEARKLSLLPMIDAIVGKMAQWFNKHRKSAAEVPETHKLVPFLENELHKRCILAQRLRVDVLNDHLLEYNVIDDRKNYLVDLSNKTCSCKYFNIDRYTSSSSLVKLECASLILCVMFVTGTLVCMH